MHIHKPPSRGTWRAPPPQHGSIISRSVTCDRRCEESCGHADFLTFPVASQSGHLNPGIMAPFCKVSNDRATAQSLSYRGRFDFLVLRENPFSKACFTSASQPPKTVDAGRGANEPAARPRRHCSSRSSKWPPDGIASRALTARLEQIFQLNRIGLGVPTPS